MTSTGTGAWHAFSDCHRGPSRRRPHRPGVSCGREAHHALPTGVPNRRGPVGGSHSAPPFACDDRDRIARQCHVQVPAVDDERRGCKRLASMHWNLRSGGPNPPAAPVVSLYDDPEQLTVIGPEPDNGGAAIDRYRLRYRVVGTMSWTPLVPGNPNWKAVLSNLANGSPCEVEVSAHSAQGWGVLVRTANRNAHSDPVPNVPGRGRRRVAGLGRGRHGLRPLGKL